VGAPQPSQDLLVPRLRPSLPVDHQQHGVRLGDAGRRLRLYRPRQALGRDGRHAGLALRARGQARGVRHQAARVHEQKVAVAPEGARVQAVARDPRGVVDDGQRFSGEAIKHGRLADVWAADDGELGQQVVGHAAAAALAAGEDAGEGEGRGGRVAALLLVQRARPGVGGVGLRGRLGQREGVGEEGGARALGRGGRGTRRGVRGGARGRGRGGGAEQLCVAHARKRAGQRRCPVAAVGAAAVLAVEVKAARVEVAHGLHARDECRGDALEALGVGRRGRGQGGVTVAASVAPAVVGGGVVSGLADKGRRGRARRLVRGLPRGLGSSSSSCNAATLPGAAAAASPATTAAPCAAAAASAPGGRGHSAAEGGGGRRRRTRGGGDGGGERRRRRQRLQGGGAPDGARAARANGRAHRFVRIGVADVTAAGAIGRVEETGEPPDTQDVPRGGQWEARAIGLVVRSAL